MSGLRTLLPPDRRAPEPPPVHPSPPAARLAAPSWLDVRLVAGLLLVLLSVVLGSKILAAGDETTAVWAVRADLAAGARISAADLERRDVRFTQGAERYVAAAAVPAGRVLSRPVGAGELLPVAALRDEGAADERFLTVPVERFHYPDGLRRGERVDIYVSPRRTATASAQRMSPRAVVTGVPVVRVAAGASGLGAASTTTGVTIAVPPAAVADVVEAVQQGALDLVRVPLEAP